MLVHVKYDGSKEEVIFMLHGTGGNENDLVQITRFIAPNATLIGIRGAVEEHEMLRYFKRYADGSFDLKDLAKQTNLLYKGMKELLEYYGLEEKNTSILGFSNGANIAINIFKEFETNLKAAMLLHPSSVRPNHTVKTQRNLSVFATTASNDAFITQKQFMTLKQEFEEANIKISDFTHTNGHQITQDELNNTKTFYSTLERRNA